LIEKINAMDLTIPQVTTIDVDAFVQLTPKIKGILKETDLQFKEFVQEFKNTIPSVA
jgi:hypothetical protein